MTRYMQLLRKERRGRSKITNSERDELDAMCPSEYNPRTLICKQCEFKSDCKE